MPNLDLHVPQWRGGERVNGVSSLRLLTLGVGISPAKGPFPLRAQTGWGTRAQYCCGSQKRLSNLNSVDVAADTADSSGAANEPDVRAPPGSAASGRLAGPPDRRARARSVERHVPDTGHQRVARAA